MRAWRLHFWVPSLALWCKRQFWWQCGSPLPCGSRLWVGAASCFSVATLSSSSATETMKTVPQVCSERHSCRPTLAPASPSFLWLCCCCSVTSSSPTLWDPMDCSTPGLPVCHCLPEFAQVHVHCIGETIQPSYPLSPFSPSAINLSQHQGLFQWVSCLFYKHPIPSIYLVILFF